MSQAWAKAAWFFPVAAILHAVVGTVVLAMLPAALPTAQGRRLALGCAGVAVVAVALITLSAPDLPASWITIVQEGFSDSTARALAGGDLHGGPLQKGFWHALRPGGAVTIREVVAVHLAAWVVLALALGLAAWRLAPEPALGVVLVVGVMVSPVWLSTALSAQPSSLAGLYVVAGLLPATGRWGLPGAVRWGTLVVLTLLMTALRPEVAAFGVAAVVAVGLQELAPGLADRVDGAAGRVADRLARIPRLAWGALLVTWLVVAPLLAAITRPRLPGPPEAAWFVWAVHPFNLAWATAPVLLLATVPVGAVVLVVRGHLAALRAPVASGLVAPAGLLLHQLYVAAAHGQLYQAHGDLAVFELFRYLPLMLPVWVLLAARVVPADLGDWPRRAWGLALILPPLAVAVRGLPQHRDGRDDRVAPFPVVGLVDGDVQRQARALLAFVDERPQCSVILRARRWGSSPEEPVVDDLLLRRHPRAGTLDVRVLPPATGLALERLAPGDLTSASCLFAWASLDCGLARHQVACGPLTAGLVKVLGEDFATRPYTFADHTGGWAGSTQGWAVYAVPVPPEVAAAAVLPPP
ncbi:MAG: hypothetical protein H6732_02290 [Alphaproteobacteria bacterium]|nr:hypothetical protein [Alphaproteobacteria bacterium]